MIEFFNGEVAICMERYAIFSTALEATATESGRRFFSKDVRCVAPGVITQNRNPTMPSCFFTRINARGAANVCAIAPRGGLKTEESSSTANFARYAENARKSAPPAQTKSAAKSFRRKKSSPKRKKISRSILRAALRKEASRSRAENRRRKRNFRLNSFGLRKKKASIRR